MPHSTDNEVLLTVRQGDDTGSMAEHQLQPVSFSRRKKWRCCALKVLVAAVCVVAVYVSCWFSFSNTLTRCLGGAHISLRNAALEMSSDALEINKLQVFLSLTPSELNVLGLSYTLSIEKLHADLGLGIGSETSENVAYVTLPDHLFINSLQGVDTLLDANFAPANPERMGKAWQTFLTQPEMAMWSHITCQIHCKIWGWLPFYFPSLSVLRPASMPAMNLVSKEMSFHRLSEMEGMPGSLRFVGNASIFNPSPVSIIVKDPLQMRVSYNSTGVGYLNVTGSKAAALHIKPGGNVVSGELTVLASANNTRAISSLMTAYSGTAHKEKNLSVSITAPVTLSSGQKSRLFDGIRMPVTFRPAAIDVVSHMAVDFVVGGRITHWPSASLNVIVHPTFHNALPVKARLEHISIGAVYSNASTEVPLFRFSQSLDANQHVIPPLGNATFHLRPFPSDLEEPGTLGLLANGFGDQTRTMHVSAKLRVIISPAFRTEFEFESDRVQTTVCVASTGPGHNCTQESFVEVATTHPTVARNH